MTLALQDIIAAFATAGPDLRLELLLDYARRLPALPDRLRSACAAGLARVPECQTPVCVFLEAQDDKARIYAQVPEESPTVRGFVAILIQAYDGAALADLAAAPLDLLEKLGLHTALSVTRTVGLHAIVARLKRDATRLAGIPETRGAPVRTPGVESAKPRDSMTLAGPGKLSPYP
jgi:cysteine desulfuration protein SufE